MTEILSSAGTAAANVADLAAKRFEVVGAGNLEGTMDVLVDNPVFELWPIGLQLAGQENVRRYYTRLTEEVLPKIERYDVLSSMSSENEIGFEMTQTFTTPDGTKTYRLFSSMTAVDGKFTGEKLFGDEEMFRIMFGDEIWSLLTPIEA